MFEEPTLKKKNKIKNKYIYFSILGSFLLVGLTYALVFFMQDFKSESMGLNTDLLTIDITEDGNVGIDNAQSQKDSDGINNPRTTFTITNNNTVDVKVTIKLEEDLSSTISNNDIRYAVFDTIPAGTIIGNLGESNNILYEFILLSKETITLQSTIWLDYYYNGVNEKFSGKYKVEFSNIDEYGYAYLRNIVGKEKGLYAVNDDGTINENGDIVNTYRYSGLNPDNYISFNNELWRIIGVFNNQIKIVKDSNLSTGKYGSTNNYEESDVISVLDKYYLLTVREEYQKYVSVYNFNVGSINLTDTGTNLSTNEQSTVYKWNIGLINASDYLYSTDPTYYNSALNDTNVSSNSWLTGTYLTINGISGGTTNVLGINNNIPTSVLTTDTTYGIRPSLYLRTDVSIIAGNGTKNKPYQITIKTNTGKEEEELEYKLLSLKIEKDLADYLLPDDGDARILSGGGGYNRGNPIPDPDFKNYVWYSGKLWRIVALNNDESIKLVTQHNITTIQWGANTTFYSDDGEGNITKSWMYEWLNEDFLDTLYNKENIVKLDSEWDITTTTATTKPTNPTKITASVGLLTAYEYTKSYSKTGSYYTGYLNNGYYWCLLTPYSSSIVRYVVNRGTLSYASPSSYSYSARPSINLSSNIKTSGGDGSLENPYTIEGDISAPTNNVTKLSERISGEYVNFNGETYRIVSIENNITKITKADYLKSGTTNVTKKLSTSIKYGSGTSSDYWDYYLNNDWYNSISTSPINYKGMIVEGDWYLGMYPYNVSYKATICTEETINQPIKNCAKLTGTDDYGALVYNGYVGLGRVGEMFTSMIGKGHNDSTTYLWTITPYSSSSVRSVDYRGILISDPPSSYSAGALPSINLSSNIVITSGLGTVDSPFGINVG